MDFTAGEIERAKAIRSEKLAAMRARAESAEAERDRLKAALEHIRDARKPANYYGAVAAAALVAPAAEGGGA